MKMTWNQLKDCINADLYRYEAGLGWRAFLHALRWEPGFRLTLLMRLCGFTRLHPLLRWSVYLPLRFWFNRLSMKLKAFMDPTSDIGPGLYIGHPFMIIINPRVTIGRNCTIGHEVTLGSHARGDRKGCPVIGSKVYVGAGAKIIGGIHIADGAAIGANAVVTRDVPENGVAAGIPARVISTRGSTGYVTNVLEDLRPAIHTAAEGKGV